MTTNLRFDCVEGANWQVLREEWRRLHAASDAPTFFLSPLWMDAWIKTFAADLNPRFLRISENGSLKGIVLLSTRRFNKGPLRMRELFLNTAGEGAHSPMVEHNALLCVPKNRSALANSMWRFVSQQDWDEISFNGIRTEDYFALSKNCETPSHEIWRDAPYVELQQIRDSEQSFLDSLSSNSRQKIRRSIKLYEQQGQIKLEYAPSNHIARAYFDELIELHQTNWNARGKSGAFASDRMRSFHSYIVETGTPKLDYQLIRIRCGSDTLGVIYNLVHERNISYYQSGFRYQSDNRLKPGLVCHSLAIQDALEAGYDEYDFLATAGDGSQYKSSLSNAERQLGWITYRRNGVKMRTVEAIRSLRQSLTRS